MMQVPVAFSVDIQTDHLVKEIAGKVETEFSAFLPKLMSKINADMDIAMSTQSALLTAKIELFVEQIIKDRVDLVVQNMIFMQKKRIAASVKKAIDDAARGSA
jgi:hypothetical protein